jgi:AraC family transcriptional regulator
MRRVSVVRDELVVPLLPVTPVRASVVSPLPGLIVEKHSIEGIEIPEHSHPTYCLHHQTSGPVDMEWWADGKHGLVKADRDSLIVLGLGSEDRLRWSGPSRRNLVSIDEAIMLRAQAGLEREGLPEIARRWDLQDNQLGALITEIGREMELGWPTGSLYGDLLGMAFTVALIQKCSTERIQIPQVKGGIPPARLRRVLEYIEIKATQDVRLDDLARTAGLSPFHFARMFRMSMNVTPHQYLMERRVEKAKALLQDGNRTITEVATQCGYPSGGHLARVFRKIVGTTPTDWRNKI